MTTGRIARIFVSGLVVILPLVITAGLILWVVTALEGMLGGVLRVLIPDQAYHPLLGLAAAVGLVFLVGLLMEGVLFQRLVEWFESVLNRIPLVKTVYNAVRDLMTLFSKSGAQKFSRVVMVRIPALPAQLLGFVTVEDFESLPFRPDQDTVAVYLPMSYQIGGYTLFLPRELLTPVDLSLEDAMRFIVTAGMSRG
jgi:uncharacterized membrane protein